MGRFIIILFIIILLAGCGNSQKSVTLEDVTPFSKPTNSSSTSDPSFTPTATANPTASATATAASTPSPTPTPTPTALPLSISGGTQNFVRSTPPPQNNASCGLVDHLDFPLDPPDARDVISGGRDFGVYRGRYQAYHAGEDWWRYRGRANFGISVYSIGHGRVTYADPNGWGRDKGVIIVRHTFPDGRTILSFYGHLDPPSVTVQTGQCLERGEKLGEIGDPRTPPHLHFEIRTHMPDETGTGYWFEDPTIAGWLPPSQTIWESRMAAWPGVLWIQPATNRSVRGIGIVNDDSYVFMEDDQFVAIDLHSGDRQWQAPSEGMIFETLVDPEFPMVYTANLVGEVDAYALPAEGSVGSDFGEGAFGDPEWSLDLEGLGFPSLMPLPGGGVLFARDGILVAISPEGEILWEAEDVPKPDDWILSENELVFSTIGGNHSLFTVDSSGLTSWQADSGGQLARRQDQPWLYDPEGVYKVDMDARTTDLVYQLPKALYGWGDILALPDGGVLIAHRDRQDRRLIALDHLGDVKWQRSYEGLVEGTVHLFMLDNMAFLTAQDEVNRTAEVTLYAVNLEDATLIHLFTGGTRSPVASDTQVLPFGEDQVLINIGGGSIVLLDIRGAISASTP